MPTTCPVCGSEAVEPRSQPEVVKVPYGRGLSIDLQIVKCRACGEFGDFANVNDERIEKALAEATKQSVGLMIDDLATQGFTMAYLERALDLPQRTMARWKSGGCSASATALLRIVRTYPWIVAPWRLHGAPWRLHGAQWRY
jgi:hypothetical protein